MNKNISQLKSEILHEFVNIASLEDAIYVLLLKMEKEHIPGLQISVTNINGNTYRGLIEKR